MLLEDFDYNLDKSRIAIKPVFPRDSAKLLVFKDSQIQDFIFNNIVNFPKKGDVLILNNTKVLRSFIKLKQNISINLCEELSLNTWSALCKNVKKLKIKDVFSFRGGEITIVDIESLGKITVRIDPKSSLDEFLNCHGEMPIPQYISKARSTTNIKSDASEAQGINNSSHNIEDDTGYQTNASDVQGINNSSHNTKDDINYQTNASDVQGINNSSHNIEDDINYQTVYSQDLGSIAAPTAGLHFTKELLEKIQLMGVKIKYVTLHVGLGTYKPITAGDINDHVMHSERVHVSQDVFLDAIDAKRRGNKVFAVGSTSLRSLEGFLVRNDINLEHWMNLDEQKFTSYYTQFSFIESFETNIYIKPGHKFELVDGLITNFHLPKSSLLVLVASFIGFENMRRVYYHAIESNYRFYSYGDTSLLMRN